MSCDTSKHQTIKYFTLYHLSVSVSTGHLKRLDAETTTNTKFQRLSPSCVNFVEIPKVTRKGDIKTSKNVQGERKYRV